MAAESDPDPRVQRTQRDVLRAASELLVEGGWSAVTHANVAKRAGYSRATLYNHWPGPADLGRAAFREVFDPAQHVPTGDLRADLIGVLTSFADALVHQHLARVLAGMAERASTDPATAELLAAFDSDGSATQLQILADHGYSREEAQTTHSVLSGALLYRVVFQQRDPTPEFIARIVDHELRTTPNRGRDADRAASPPTES